MTDFSREERAVLAQYSKEPRNRLDTLASYSVYIFPSSVFALYGSYKADFAAIAVAYVALLVTVIAGLSYQHRRAGIFRSAVSKCLERIAELERATGLANEGVSA